MSSDVHESISWLEKIIGDTTLGKEGIQEVKYITSACNQLDLNNVKLNLTLARGLNYYTGSILRSPWTILVWEALLEVVDTII